MACAVMVAADIIRYLSVPVMRMPLPASFREGVAPDGVAGGRCVWIYRALTLLCRSCGLFE